MSDFIDRPGALGFLFTLWLGSILLGLGMLAAALYMGHAFVAAAFAFLFGVQVGLCLPRNETE